MDTCRFRSGQKYMGYSTKSRKYVSIMVIKKTPQYIFYESDTGISGKALVRHMNGNEAVLVEKLDKLLVNSADIWS